MARLDRLEVAREVAQLAATLGREFSYDLLEAVVGLDEATLRRGLAQLVDAELVYQRGQPPQARYLFKHALIQDAAYQSLLRSTRQQYHQRIAEVLAARFPETVAAQPELLAHHLTEAGQSAQAVDYWQRAGACAEERSAHVEAISHLTRGLEVLQTLPDTPERTQHEFLLHLALSTPLVMTQGWGAADVERAYTRAFALSQHMGEVPPSFPELLGQWRFYLVRAQLQTAHTLAEQLLTLAQRVHDPVASLIAHFAPGITLFFLGDFVQARPHMEQVIALHDPQAHRPLASRFGEDLGVACLSHLAFTLWTLGYPDQALSLAQQVLTLGHEIMHPHTLAAALHWNAWLYQLRREDHAAQTRAEAGIALGHEQAFPHIVALCMVWRGWALAVQGQSGVGLAQMHQGQEAWRATGGEITQPFCLTLLAEAYGTMGQADTGMALLAEAQAQAQATGERWFEAEMYRLRGELLLAASVDNSPDAEACLHQALAVARRQQAKSLELRAAMSLARLWRQQGKRAEARQVLAQVYDWFTEGFDTADLQEARTLLDAL